MPGQDEKLKSQLALAGIDAETSQSALELDAIMQHWRRRVVKRELGHRALADLGLDLDLPLLDALMVVATPANEFGTATGDHVMVATVADRLGIDPSRASRLSSELIRIGLVAREVSQEDARRAVLVLTPRGNEIVQAVRRYKFLILGSFLKGWTPEELAGFIPMLERFSAWSETSDEPSAPIAEEIAKLRKGLTDGAG